MKIQTFHMIFFVLLSLLILKAQVLDFVYNFRCDNEGSTAQHIETDSIVDIGPEGGQRGGKIQYRGIPENILKLRDNHTARFLKTELK